MKIRVLLLALFLVCTATICRAQEEKEPKSKDYYLENGVTIVTSNHSKPYSFVGVSGDLEGYLIDVWKKWSKKTGIPIRFIYKDWDGTLESMKNGEADLHSGLFYSDERAMFIDFGEALHSSSDILILRNGADVDCSNALSHGSVAVVSGSHPDEYLRAYHPEANRVEFATTNEAVDSMLDRQTDAIVISYPMLVMRARERKMEDRYSVCRTISYRDTHVGVQKGETELLALVNEGMAEIDSGEWKRMESRWFITVDEKPRLAWETAVIPAVAAFALIILMVVVWFRRRA
ncbi:transporter substrate-binding domain-containing protein [Pseudodesulfovibrio sp. zrk46]|uniref:transporter substrate-binding domain-containing protein n=1 Tax=Pseudodesulfovibrio sp. zrk46 TaxID=2725288 RepID=UPI00144A19A6|nr:transporter substrate-binding domain-containing protein [Pseudodesulfovibrio sp. zrk46]QJB55404.1 transporter substrate-binding domain-containing protein [Pseudodesulfovibrio sp. zrk46]